MNRISPRLAAGFSFLRQNRWQVLSTLGVLLIVAAGWSQRYQTAALPVLDADSLGYLKPVLSFYHGEGLQQAHGRGVFYPSMLIAFLGSELSFSAMVRWQQTLGLLGALALWGCWLVFWNLLPANGFRNISAGLVGPAFMAFYSFNPSVAFYEHTLRPESVLPFFGSIQLLATGIYLLARCGRLPGRWLIPAGALAVLFAYFCLALKPSWILASCAAVGLVLGGWFRARERTRPALLGLAAGLAASAIFFAVYKVWMKPDLQDSSLAPDTFLAKTLITTHADIILPALEQEIRDPNPSKSAFPLKVLRKFTAHLRKEMLVARAEAERYPQWKVHGVRYPFSPDYLMFTTDLAAPLKKAGMTRKEIARFYFRCYLLGAWRNPADMTQKIAHNLGLFFRPDHHTFYREPWFESALEESRAFLFEIAPSAELAPRDRERLQAEAEHIQATGDAARSAARDRDFAALFNSWTPWICTATPMVAILFLAVAVQAMSISSFRRAFGLSLLFVLFLYSVPLANALNVAIAQSLPVLGRYRQTYGMFYVFSLAAMVAFLLTAYGQIISMARRAGPPDPPTV